MLEPLTAAELPDVIVGWVEQEHFEVSVALHSRGHNCWSDGDCPVACFLRAQGYNARAHGLNTFKIYGLDRPMDPVWYVLNAVAANLVYDLMDRENSEFPGRFWVRLVREKN